MENKVAARRRIIEGADQAFVYDNSGDSLSVYPFIQGVAGQTLVPLTPFLQARLMEPLKQREKERKLIGTTLGTTIQPNMEYGRYLGPLVWHSKNYFVQEVSDRLILHDRLLVSTTAGVGDVQTIVYDDGVGVATSSGVPS